MKLNELAVQLAVQSGAGAIASEFVAIVILLEYWPNLDSALLRP